MLQELAAYRKAKEEEALKMSVLDAEAAARFSTAAALDARERLAIPASGGHMFEGRQVRVLGSGRGFEWQWWLHAHEWLAIPVPGWRLCACGCESTRLLCLLLIHNQLDIQLAERPLLCPCPPPRSHV